MVPVFRMMPYIAAMSDPDQVRDNPDRHRFELTVDGHTAYSVYRIDGPVITFIHTVVPQALQGKGAGSRLVAGALMIVRQRGLQVCPQCPFVHAYMDRHPETQDLLAPKTD
jgi:uncharacterized protein